MLAYRFTDISDNLIVKLSPEDVECIFMDDGEMYVGTSEGEEYMFDCMEKVEE